MRRVVVTPTFAAGLGVVIAAVLAYPMARTVFRYSAPDGQPCQLKRCGVGAQGNVPALASAKPGLPLVTPTPSVSPASRTPDPVGTHPYRPPWHGQPVIDYQTVHQQMAAFVATLTVITPSRLPSGGWRVGFTYPSATILSVWGGAVLSQSPHSVVVQGSQAGPQGIRLRVEVTGRAGPPATCVFNGQPCRIVTVAAAGAGH